jgi:hypothetical protein
VRCGCGVESAWVDEGFDAREVEVADVMTVKRRVESATVIQYSNSKSKTQAVFMWAFERALARIYRKLRSK